VRIGPREKGIVPGWWCDAEVDRRGYRVGILSIPKDGSRPEIWGVVRDSGGKILWQEQVHASISAAELLRRAGIT